MGDRGQGFRRHRRQDGLLAARSDNHATDALLAAVGLGAYFVQNAYASGPPDLVIAGLTVIDPLVAVTVGIVILNEAAGAELWQVIAFLVSGAVAIVGVFLLARVHPGLPSNGDASTSERPAGEGAA